MATTPPTMDRPNSFLLSDTAGNWDQQRTFRSRCDRITFGFWLGGGILGTAGCILRASMPHHPPVARGISVLLGGIYLGCFGARLGALPRLFMGRTPPRLPPA